MANMTVLLRNATTFTKTKELDEEAFRKFLQRLVDSKIGVYLASGGSGEGHALTRAEIKRVYEIGVEVCKGKVPVNANPPEGKTALETIEHAKLAIAAGIEVVNLYGPMAAHGYQPTDVELTDYYEDVLAEIKHPVALGPLPTVGYTPKATVIADICNRYRQVVAVNFAGLRDSYFIAVKDRLTRDVETYVPFESSLHTLGLGANGLLGAHANIIPKTLRRYIDLYERKDFAALAPVYADVLRFSTYVERWPHATPRWLKMAMRVLKLPGGEGGLRKPYRMPPDDEVQRFSDGLLKLHVPEIDEMARAAGLA